MDNITIRAYVPADASAIEAVHTAAFPTLAEAKLVAALHRGYAPVSLVAVHAGAIVGHVLFSKLSLEVDGRPVSALALAPVAVAPAHQSMGIGAALIHAGHAKAKADGWEAAVVLGEPDYYRRFGYDARAVAHIASPYAGEYLQGLEFVPGVLAGETGHMEYAPPFHDLA
jgi:putative acetyltransferase